MRLAGPALAAGIMVSVGSMMAPAQAQLPPGGSSVPSPDRPVIDSGRPVAEVQGIWRSRGYGHLLRIDADGLSLFHVAGSFCYADPRRADHRDGMFALYRPVGPNAVAFSGTPGQTRYVFDRLPDLPAACTDRAEWTPPRIAALVAATFTDIYPSFAERGIDWSARAAAAGRGLNDGSTDGELFDNLQDLLAGIEDAHVELHAEIGGKERSLTPGEAGTLLRVRANTALGAHPGKREREWRRAYHRGIRTTVLGGNSHWAANDCVLWGRVRDIGYINFLCMEGFTADRPDDDPTALDAALDAAMAGFQGARAVIVDITDNDGGHDKLAQRIAGRFAERPHLAYRKVAFGAKGVEPQPFEVEPSDRQRYTGPVYLLTSDITLSAAEVFALYMRALPNVIHIGETTRGAFSDQIDKPLPNGWFLVLSAEIYRDPDGNFYEVRGLPPQVKREIFPANDLTQGHARRVLDLMDEIRRGAAPTRR
jgi:carboxyl-terminal processing protease